MIMCQLLEIASQIYLIRVSRRISRSLVSCINRLYNVYNVRLIEMTLCLGLEKIENLCCQLAGALDLRKHGPTDAESKDGLTVLLHRANDTLPRTSLFDLVGYIVFKLADPIYQ